MNFRYLTVTALIRIVCVIRGYGAFIDEEGGGFQFRGTYRSYCHTLRVRTRSRLYHSATESLRLKRGESLLLL